jgi:hypothetical protein
MKSLKRVVLHDNPNHHLWNNNGTWFVHYTVYPTPVTKQRVRMSLKTRSVAEARQRRDQQLVRRTGSVGRPPQEVQLLAV